MDNLFLYSSRRDLYLFNSSKSSLVILPKDLIFFSRVWIRLRLISFM